MNKLSLVKKAALIASTAPLFLVSPILAQQSADNKSIGIEVSSPLYEYTIKPGSVQQDIIKIKNVGSQVQTYFPQALDFKSDNKSGTPVFLKEGEENGTYSLAKWILVSKDKITIEPGKSEALNFNISVPEDAEPGGHYAGILFSTEPVVPTEGTGIGLTSKVGSLVLVRVAGDAKEAAKITDFSADKDTYDKAEVKFSTTVENTGNVHVQPKGVIEVKNVFGGTVAGLDVNQLASNVLPGSSRIFDSSWKDPGFKLGYYTATVTLSYGDPAQTTTSKTNFWIIPWMTLLIALIVIAIVLAVLIFAIKRYNHWIVAKAQKQA